MKRLFGKKKEEELLQNEEAFSENAPLEDVPQEEDKRKKRDASIYSWVESFVLVPVIVIFIFAFLGRTSVVSGSSMYDTLEDGDMMLISNLFYEPQYGDIVVLTQPSYGTDPLVKRVIATEGQTVDIDFARGVVIVDGEELSEPYTYTPTNNQYDVEFPITVKEGHIFVLGDNRNGSYDSRGASIGQIDKRMVMGKAYLRILPFGKFGSLKFER